MTLDEFCKDSWIEVKDSEKTYRKSRHCYEKEIDLYRAIARWQFDQVEKRLHRIESAGDEHKEIRKAVCYLKNSTAETLNISEHGIGVSAL